MQATTGVKLENTMLNKRSHRLYGLEVNGLCLKCPPSSPVFRVQLLESDCIMGSYAYPWINPLMRS